MSGNHSNSTTSVKKAPTTRSASTDSTTSTESSASSTTVTPSTRPSTHTTAKQTTKPEVPAAALRPRGSIELVAEKKPFQSRFLPNHQTPKKDETESSSEEESTSEESEEEEEEPKPAVRKASVSSSTRDAASKTDIGPLLNRSSQARESYADTKRNSRDETYNSRTGGYSSPTYGSRDDDSKTTSSIRSRANHHTEPDDHSSRYGTGSSG